jgi:tRNA(Ile)-lysidine synthase
MRPASRAPLDTLLARLSRRLAADVRPGAGVCVAYSGGRDSAVLLDALCRLRGAHDFSLSARHVHHGLSLHADAWAAHAEAYARARAVPLEVVRVSVDRGSRAGLEAQARQVRYAALRAAGADVVALAHHRDDQAETVLLQALRGAGLKGLAAMPVVRQEGACRWWRPLLDETRESIDAYAHAAGLDWVHDESNDAPAAARNVLRLGILPALAPHFPQARESLAALASHAALAQRVLDEVAAEDLGRLETSDGIDAAGLAGLSSERQAGVLRAALARRGLPMPSRSRLEAMRAQLLTSRADAQPCVAHAGWEWRRHAGALRLEPIEASAPGGWACSWHGATLVALGGRRGWVRFRESDHGIDPARIPVGEWRFALRQGGERLRPRPGGPSRTLKNLWREAGVPVTDRERLPLLFHDGRLVWAPGVGVCADHAARPGWVPEWFPNPPGA